MDDLDRLIARVQVSAIIGEPEMARIVITDEAGENFFYDVLKGDVAAISALSNFDPAVINELPFGICSGKEQ